MCKTRKSSVFSCFRTNTHQSKLLGFFRKLCFSRKICHAHINNTIQLLMKIKRNFVKICSQIWLQCEIPFEQLEQFLSSVLCVHWVPCGYALFMLCVLFYRQLVYLAIHTVRKVHFSSFGCFPINTQPFGRVSTLVTNWDICPHLEYID